MIEDKLSFEAFNANLLSTIHKRLFGELYDWAGDLRTVEVSKGETSFARVEYLSTNIQALFDRLKDDKYLKDLDFDAFTKALARYYGDLVVLHPFREGNGRAIRTLLAMLAEKLGWDIAWGDMDPQQNIDACIASYQRDNAALVLMLSTIVDRLDPFWEDNPHPS